METILSKDHEEMAAIGAAVAANCEPCLRYHIQKAREAGLTDAQLRDAVAVARKVKETPARRILETADRLLGASPLPAAEPTSASCCG